MENVADNNFIWLPTVEQELMLKAGLFRDSSAIDAWQNWKNITSTERIFEAETRLLPLIYQNLQQLNYVDDSTELLKRAHLAAFIDTRLRLQKATTIITAFANNGVRTILLKGMALGIAYYESIALRPMSDIDLLIHQDDLVKAVEVLGSLGFDPESGDLSLATEIMNAWHFETSGGDVVDIHWRLMRDCWNADKVDSLWDAAVAIKYDSLTLETLCATDHLFHACGHGARYNPVSPIRWISDALMILNSSAEIDWDRLYQLGKTHRLNLLLFHSLSYLKKTFNAPVPEDYLQRVKLVQTTRLERMSFHHFSQPPRAWTTKRYGQELVFQYSTLGSRAFAKYLYLFTRRKFQQWSPRKPYPGLNRARNETVEIAEAGFPSEKDLRKLLLKFILLEGEDAVAAFAEWERLVVFDDSSFQSFKLLSAVYPKLLEHNLGSRLLLRIKGAHRRTWTENQLLLTHLNDLFADLNALQINFIVADEAFRVTEIYNDLGIFSLQNFSVMAPIRQKKELCGRLIENLWEICDDGVGRTHCKRDKVSGVDLLWTDDKEFDDQCEGAERDLVEKISVPIVRVEAQILNLCENRFMVHGDEESDWQFIAGALFKSGKIDSSKLIELARRRRLTYELAKMIDLLAGDFDLKVPHDLLAELGKSRPPGRVMLIGGRINSIRQDYRLYLQDETRHGPRAGLIEFLERRWGVDSYGDLVRQGIRSCMRLLHVR